MMKPVAFFARIFLLSVAAMFSTAHAYIDPATGSLVLQLLSGMLLGLLIFFRRIKLFLSSTVQRLLSLFKR